LAANAASVQLQPETAQVAGTFDIDLYLNATDSVGGHPGQFSGRVVIEYDPTLVSFVGFSYDAPASELYAVDQTDFGFHETVSLGFKNALDDTVIGSYTFNLLPGASGVIGFSVYDYNDAFGSFANELPTNYSFVPSFVGTEVTVVPLPAAFWLFGSALAGMAWVRRGEIEAA
jgi:hypothetical protein